MNEAQVGEVRFDEWVIIRDPGCVPERKGPFRPRQVAGFLREVFRARPFSFVEVITVHEDGTLSVQDGPECLMVSDWRSRSTATAHNKRLRSVYNVGASHAQL